MTGRKHHHYQWGKTANALNDFCNLYSKQPDDNLNERLEKVLINDQKVFATEKLDGTNVAKDECGHMYGRRCHLGQESVLYQKTSLKKVLQADVAKLKLVLCQEADIREQQIEKFLIYGELVCNTRYDYKERHLVGDWRVFGAMLCIGEGTMPELFGKLMEAGFAVAKDSEEGKIWIYPCSKFFFCVTQCEMETVNVKANAASIVQIVTDNLEDMQTGKLEGIVFTTASADGCCYKVLKWKGAQEYQPSGELMIKDVFADSATNKQISNPLKMFYKNLADVALAGPEKNPLVLKKSRYGITTLEGSKKKAKTDRQGDGLLRLEDKKFHIVGNNSIDLGIYHSMEKFDDIDTWLKNGSTIEAYIRILQDETKKHYAEEKSSNKIEDNVAAFIDARVAQIVYRFVTV